jgi:hypothetical protein
MASNFLCWCKESHQETPNTSLFEWCWFKRRTPLRRVVRSVATSIHGHVKGLFFQPRLAATFCTVIPAKAGIQAVLVNELLEATQLISWIPAFAGMTKNRARWRREVLPQKIEPKTLPGRQWPLVEPTPHVCAPAPSHLSPNRLVFRCFLGDFFCTSKRSYSAAGPRPGAVPGVAARNTQAIRLESNDAV